MPTRVCAADRDRDKDVLRPQRSMLWRAQRSTLVDQNTWSNLIHVTHFKHSQARCQQ